MVGNMKDCNKKSPLRCLNCKKENCDLKKITIILNELGVLKNKHINNDLIGRLEEK